MKSLALVSKVKSLASRRQVLKNWPVLGSWTAVFFELLKFCEALEKFLENVFFCGDCLKNFCEDLFFFWRSPKKFFEDLFFVCFWRALALVSLVLGLGLESVCPRKGCPWPWPRALCPRLHHLW